MGCVMNALAPSGSLKGCAKRGLSLATLTLAKCNSVIRPRRYASARVDTRRAPGLMQVKLSCIADRRRYDIEFPHRQLFDSTRVGGRRKMHA